MGDLLKLTPRTDRFELFSLEPDVIQAYEDKATGKKMFRGVASSTTKDLHGDTILLSALEDMERTAVGKTMFLNHSYDVPNDVGGTITRAVIKQKGVDEKGDPSYQLEIEGEVEEDNDDAVKTWRFVQKGRKIGLSIGAMIPDNGAKRQKDGSYIIEHLLLLEVSFVGIPANPKSWVEYAASALRGLEKDARTMPLGSPTLTLDGKTYKIEGSLDDLQIDLELGEPAVVLGKDGQPLTEPEVDWQFAWDRDNKVEITRSVITPVENGMAEMTKDVLGSWDLTDPDEKIAAIALAGEEAVTKATVWVETRDGDKITIGDPPDETAEADPDVTTTVEPDVTDGTCPTCGKGRGASGCDDAYHKDAEPDVTDAKVRIIEVDTDAPASGDGQGASSDSEPDDATLSAQPVILDGLTETELLKLSFGQLRAAALAAASQLGEITRLHNEEKQARIAAETQRDALQSERDAVLTAAGELVKRTQAVIEKVASSPLARKAVVEDVSKEFATSVAQFYGEEFARTIVGRST